MEIKAVQTISQTYIHKFSRLHLFKREAHNKLSAGKRPISPSCDQHGASSDEEITINSLNGWGFLFLLCLIESESDPFEYHFMLVNVQLNFNFHRIVGGINR